jgi:formylmethanofuran dehydrogenase subunit E
MDAIQTNETDMEEITLLICDRCFEIIFEEDAEYHKELPYCHRCIEEIRQDTGFQPTSPRWLL